MTERDSSIVQQYSLEDLLDVGPVRRPACTGKRPAPTSPLSLRQEHKSMRITLGGTNWTNRDKAYSAGPRMDNFGNPHPSDVVIQKLGYTVMHHIDGQHNSRTRLTSRPYAKLGRQRPAYQPRGERSWRLDSPEAVVRNEMTNALTCLDVCEIREDAALPARLKFYIANMDAMVHTQKQDLRCKTWITPNRWRKKRQKIQQQWDLEIRRLTGARPAPHCCAAAPSPPPPPAAAAGTTLS